MHISISTSTSPIIGANSRFTRETELYDSMVISTAYLTIQNMKQKLGNIVIFLFQFWRLESKSIWMTYSGISWIIYSYWFVAEVPKRWKILNVKTISNWHKSCGLKFRRWIRVLAVWQTKSLMETANEWIWLVDNKAIYTMWMNCRILPTGNGDRANWETLETRNIPILSSLVVGTWDVGVVTLRRKTSLERGPNAFHVTIVAPYKIKIQSFQLFCCKLVANDPDNECGCIHLHFMGQ